MCYFFAKLKEIKIILAYFYYIFLMYFSNVSLLCNYNVWYFSIFILNLSNNIKSLSFFIISNIFLIYLYHYNFIKSYDIIYYTIETN